MTRQTLKLRACVFLSQNFPDFDQAAIDATVRLLKEQDRDTRHACAELIAVIQPYIDGLPRAISKDDAHDAIMNCRGGYRK